MNPTESADRARREIELLDRELEIIARKRQLLGLHTPASAEASDPPVAKRRGKDAKRAAPAEWLGHPKRCPHCKKMKDKGRDFDTRMGAHGLEPQSWCRACRNADAKAKRLTKKAERKNAETQPQQRRLTRVK